MEPQNISPTEEQVFTMKQFDFQDADIETEYMPEHNPDDDYQQVGDEYMHEPINVQHVIQSALKRVEEYTSVNCGSLETQMNDHISGVVEAIHQVESETDQLKQRKVDLLSLLETVREIVK